jgi:hypothetical protein
VTPLIAVASLQSPYFIERDEGARLYSPQLSLATRQELGSNFGSKLTATGHCEGNRKTKLRRHNRHRI